MSQDPSIPPSPAATGPESAKLPDSWQEALTSLIGARLTLIQLESKPALASGIRKIALLAIAAFLLLLAWLILVAATVAAIAAHSSWTWYHTAFAAAGLHFLLAIILLVRAKSPAPAAFPFTRAEFQKDREWLHQLKNNRKSGN